MIFIYSLDLELTHFNFRLYNKKLLTSLVYITRFFILIVLKKVKKIDDKKQMVGFANVCNYILLTTKMSHKASLMEGVWEMYGLHRIWAFAFSVRNLLPKISHGKLTWKGACITSWRIAWAGNMLVSIQDQSTAVRGLCRYRRWAPGQWHGIGFAAKANGSQFSQFAIPKFSEVPVCSELH